MELADRIPLIILAPNTHLFHGAFKGHPCERFCTHKHYIPIEAENKTQNVRKATLKEIDNKYKQAHSSRPISQ